MAKKTKQGERVVKSIYITGIGSFLNLFVPRAVEAGQKEKFSAAILVPKSDKAQLKTLRAAMDEVALEFFGPGWNKLKKGGKDFWYPLQDGDVKAEEDPRYNSYKGHFYINASNERPVGVLNVDKRPTTSNAEVYSGCTIQALVNLYSYVTMGNGIGVSLQSVRVLYKGKRLDGSVEATDVQWPEEVPDWATKQMEAADETEEGESDENGADEDEDEEEDLLGA